MLGNQVDSCFKCGYKYSNEKDLLKIKSLNELYEYCGKQKEETFNERLWKRQK